jgi:hypothetical protein
MVFQDFVPSGRVAGAVQIQIRDPNGLVQPTVGGQISYQAAPAGQYCVEPGGTHVRTHGSNGCFTVRESGARVYGVVENAPDVKAFFSGLDAYRYRPGRQRVLADASRFGPQWLRRVTRGIGVGAACANVEPSTITLGSTGDLSAWVLGPPPGFDMLILADLSGVGWDLGHFVVMMAPTAGEREGAAAELELHGITGRYGGFESGGTVCAYAISYSTAAIRAGAL